MKSLMLCTFPRDFSNSYSQFPALRYFLKNPQKQNQVLSRWKSFLKVLLYPALKIPENEGHIPSDKKLFIEAKIGFRNGLSEPWKLLHAANISRPYDCTKDENYGGYDCDAMDLIELGMYSSLM